MSRKETKKVFAARETAETKHNNPSDYQLRVQYANMVSDNFQMISEKRRAKRRNLPVEQLNRSRKLIELIVRGDVDTLMEYIMLGCNNICYHMTDID